MQRELEAVLQEPDRLAAFTFVADGRDKWGLGFLIASDDQIGKRSPGSQDWGGLGNLYFWIDSTSGVAGVIVMPIPVVCQSLLFCWQSDTPRAQRRRIGK
jgi:hypothetical protein